MMEQDGLPYPRRAWAQATLLIVISMTVLDTAIANVALPGIARHLHAQVADSIWVVNAYQMSLTLLTLPCASAGEIIGFRRISQTGMAIFTIASLACALSHSLPMLIAARMLQGAGAAAAVSVSSALLRHVVPRAQLGRGIGLSAFTVGVSASIAPSIASAILSVASWPWLFAVNVPFGIAAFVIALRALPETPRHNRPFDWFSAILSALTLGSMVMAVDALAHAGHPGLVLGGIVLSLAAGALLVRRQRARVAPLLPIDLLRIPAFGLAIATSIASFAAQTTAFVAIPFFLEYSLNRGQVSTGLLMTPWPLATAALAPIAGRLADRRPAGLLGGIGLSVLAIGLAALALLPAQPPNWAIVACMVLCGAGFGFFQSPNNRAMLAASPHNRSGGASGMLATARTMGQTFGAALAALVFGLLGDHAGAASIGLAAAVAAIAAAVSLSRLHLLD